VSDDVQVDAQRAQQLSVTGSRTRHYPPFPQASQRGPDRRQVHPTNPQDPGGPAPALGQQPEQHMLGAEVAVASPLGLLPGQVQDPMGGLGEAAKHLTAAQPGTIHPPALLHRAHLGQARPKLRQ
jgi:hypothetical protein